MSLRRLAVYANRPVETAAKKTRSLDDMDSAMEPVPTVPAEVEPDPTPVVASENHYPIRVGAHRLHQEGITGYGVTVAVLDTGIHSQNFLNNDTDRTPASAGPLRCHHRRSHLVGGYR